MIRVVLVMLVFVMTTGNALAGRHKHGFTATKIAADERYASEQLKLGDIYYDGQGVPQDYKEAVKWYRLASEQGHAHAQFMLGFMYIRGQGVTRNYILGHMWLNIASGNGDKEAAKIRDSVAGNELVGNQVDYAQQLAMKCVANNYKGCDDI